MKKAKRRKTASSRKYESSGETKAAIARIHDCFEESKQELAAEKEKAASPEGVLRSALQALLKARKTVAATRQELDEAISLVRRSLPRG